MTFSRPELLVVIPVILVLLSLALVQYRRRMSRLVSAYGNSAAARLLPIEALHFPTKRVICLLIAGLAIGLAAAGPGETINQDLQSAAEVDIAIVVDASISMTGSDIEPTRIERTRDVVVQLAKAAPKGRLSLVVLGDWPYTLVPPTDDSDSLTYFARSLTGSLVANLASSIRTATGDRGAPMQDAIAHARELLRAPSAKDRKQIVLLISDGAVSGAPEAILAAAAAGAKDRVAIWTAGVGASASARIGVGGGRAFDPGGALMTAGYDDQLLRSIAAAGGGLYENVSTDRGSRALVSNIRRLSGVAGPDDVVPERIAFGLIVLALVVIVLDSGLDIGRLGPRGGAAEDFI